MALLRIPDPVLQIFTFFVARVIPQRNRKIVYLRVIRSRTRRLEYQHYWQVFVRTVLLPVDPPMQIDAPVIVFRSMTLPLAGAGRSARSPR